MFTDGRERDVWTSIGFQPLSSMDVSRLEQRAYVKIAVLCGQNARECHAQLIEAVGDHALPYWTVARWVPAIQLGWVASTDMPCTGCPMTAYTDVACVVIATHLATVQYKNPWHDGSGEARPTELVVVMWNVQYRRAQCPILLRVVRDIPLHFDHKAIFTYAYCSSWLTSILDNGWKPTAFMHPFHLAASISTKHLNVIATCQKMSIAVWYRTEKYSCHDIYLCQNSTRMNYIYLMNVCWTEISVKLLGEPLIHLIIIYLSLKFSISTALIFIIPCYSSTVPLFNCI